MDIDKFVGLGGHIYDEKNIQEVLSRQKYPMIAGANNSIKGQARGKRLFLTDILKKVVGRDLVRTQTIGDCVSQSTATACDLLKAIAVTTKNEEWEYQHDSTSIYALGRHEIGKDSWLRYGDGMSGAAGANAAQLGTLLMKSYQGVNLTDYDGVRARDWGKTGLPDMLESIAKIHPVKHISLVTTYYDLIDSLFSGFAVTIASDVGYNGKRNKNGQICLDKNGFLSPAGSWNHSLLACGFDDNPNRPGILIMNSWGPDWVTSGKELGIPPGAFMVDADSVERMLKSQDSFSFCDLDGYFPRKLDLRLL